MPTRNVDLTDHFEQFIEDGIDSGRFSTVSQVVDEGLRLLEQREQEEQAKIEWLRAAATEALESIERGEGYELDTGDELEAFMHEIGKEVAVELAAERVRG